MKTSTKLILMSSLLGILGLGGVIRIVYAAQPQIPIATIPEHQSSHPIARANDDGAGETQDDTEERQESFQLQSLATITPQQAQKVAEIDRGSPAKRIKLENEDGNLVYTVEIGQQEVKVDAGNGRILYTEALDREDEKTEASHPRSSIQVNEPPGGDGDGETN
ncbi:MAG: peptidase, partial [Cyanobacteria bacterium J055]